MSSTKWNTAEQWGKDHVLISSTETTEFPLRSKSQALGSGFTLHLKSRLFFSCSVRSDSLQPHWLQHARLPCPSPTPRACSNACLSSPWYHPSHPLLSPSPVFNLSQHQGSFPVSQFFTSGCQSIGASASASVLPMNIQGWFPLGLTGWISLQSKGLWRVFSSTTVQKHQFFSA